MSGLSNGCFVRQAVKAFQVTLAAVHKASRACEAIIGAITRTPCCVAPQPAASGQMLSLQEACAMIEAQHQEVVLPPINEISKIK